MSTMQIELSKLGQWTEERPFAVDAERTKAYAAAINDDNPLHTGGVLAPPLFASVPIAEHIWLSVVGLISDDDRQWGVHGDQDMFFYRSMAPGMVVRTKAAPIGVHPRLRVTSVVIKTETRGPDGHLVNEGHLTLAFRRKYVGQGSGEQAPDHGVPAESKAAARSVGQIISVTHTIDPDQTYRYAEAAGDRNPIHLDPEFARSVGLPGIIVHGICTMGFASRAVIKTVCADDPTRLKRLAVRFARPVLPGQAITTHLWPAGERFDRRIHGFETINPAGKAVLVDGLAEVAG